MIATTRRLVLLLTTVASSGYIARVAVTVAAPGLMREFDLTPVQMGTVFSAFLLGYTFCQLPSGALADRVDARRIFTALCAAWTALTISAIGVGWASSAPAIVLAELCLLRALFGIAAAPTYPTSARAIAGTVPAGQQARANSIVLSSVGIGSALTPLVFAPVANRVGWRASLAVAAGLCAAAGAIWWRFAPEVDAAERRAAPRIHSRHLGSASFWFLCASYFLQAYLGYIFIFWFYLYLVQVRHFEVLDAAAFSALPWMATIVAIPAGGILSDVAVDRWGEVWGRRLVPAVALCGAAIFLIVGARTANALVAVASLTVCTVLVLSTEGPFWATMTAHAGDRSGLGGGTMNFAGNLGGLISPTLTPWLADRIGWDSALSLTAVLGAVAGALWLGVAADGNANQRAEAGAGSAA